MSDTYVPRLPVQQIDHIAESDPSRLICLVPKGNDPRDGFHEITFQHFARAVDYLASTLEKSLGHKNSFQTFGFLGHGGDFRYILLAVAAMKIGWAAFFTSPRNSMVAHLSLLDQAKCETWLVDDEVPPIVGEMVKQHPMRFVQIPHEQFFLMTIFGDDNPKYPYTKSFDEGVHDVYAILHTSGSTGIPKVIPQHLSILTVPNAYKALPRSNFQYKHFEGLTMFSTLPWFHSAAYMTTLGAAIYYRVVTIIAPAAPITAELVDRFHQYSDADMSMVPPFILQQIASNPSYLENCKQLKFIANVGGPSTFEVGEILAKYTHPVQIAGATEMGMWISELLSPSDFMYWSFDPICGGEYRPIDGKHFEYWIVRDDDYKLYRPVFDTFPDLKEWSTKDIFIKHPTKPNVWQLVGRTDDVVVLSTGEKVNSVTIEGDVGSYSGIQGALVFGEGRFQLGLLLELDPQHMTTIQSSLDTILERINQKSVAHGHISKNMVIFSSPEKPFPRAGKGTVQKKMCLELYKEEIDALYSRSIEQPKDGSQPEIKYGYERIAAYLEKWIAAETGFSPPARERDVFLAGIGVDSLLVLRLVQALNAIAKHLNISPQDVYRNPTISKLTRRILEIQGDSASIDWSDDQHVDAMLKKYGKNLPLNMRLVKQDEGHPLTVAVTGTTGSLGKYILRSLIKQFPRVGKIYCLNRKDPAEVAQTNEQTKVPNGDTHIEIEHLRICVCKPRLGLDLKSYTDLARNVDLVIHNAWEVNFNLGVDSFEQHVHGVRQLIDLCAYSQKNASLHFMSTVSTVMKWHPNADTAEEEKDSANETSKVAINVPEQLYEHHEVSLRMGYALSKHISERLLAQACEESNINVKIYRIGQIAGPISQGDDTMWSKHEWVPSMIQTAMALNVFPSDLGALDHIDWIPIDVLGEVLVELALTTSAPSPDHSASLNIFHTVNPHAISWSEVLPVVLKHASSDKTPLVLPLNDWIEKVRAAVNASGKTNDELSEMPAVKMGRFFRKLGQTSPDRTVRLNSTNACAHSKILSGLESVKPEWMESWMRQWNFEAPRTSVVVNGEQ